MAALSTTPPNPAPRLNALKSAAVLACVSEFSPAVVTADVSLVY